LISRPDIVFASSRLARFIYNPGEIHLITADRVIRYLDGTRIYTPEFGGLYKATINIFEGSSNVSFVNLLNIRSIQRWYFFLFGGSIDWKTSVQSIVGRSTTKVKLKALSTAGVDLI
jgi:hypothetical protein